MANLEGKEPRSMRRWIRSMRQAATSKTLCVMRMGNRLVDCLVRMAGWGCYSVNSMDDTHTHNASQRCVLRIVAGYQSFLSYACGQVAYG